MILRQAETNGENSNPDPAPQDHISDNSKSQSNATTYTVPSTLAEEVAVASNTLKALAQQNGFTIHDVPRDGNCQFSAIAYQLEFVNASETREIVANHLENNSVFYYDFLPQPVASNSASNADTEAPTAYIHSVQDPEQQN